VKCLLSQRVMKKFLVRITRKLSERKKEIVRHYTVRSDLVLDAGCGNGYYTQTLMSNINHVVGVDLNSKSLCDYKRKIGKKASVIRAALESLPFKHNAFDQCLLLDSLEHSKNPILVLKQVHGFLNQSGQLIATMPNWYNQLLDREKLLHKHFHSSFGWKRILEQSYFKVIFITSMGLPILDSRALANHLHFFGFWLLFVARA